MQYICTKIICVGHLENARRSNGAESELLAKEISCK